MLILTILFTIFVLLGLIISITGLRKPELFLAFEQKCHGKIFKKEFNPNELTKGKIRKIAVTLLCGTIIGVILVAWSIYLRLK